MYSHQCLPWPLDSSGGAPCSSSLIHCPPPSCCAHGQVAAPLLRTLAAMHAVGVTHRDVKLENIFLDASGDVKLGDFDLAVFHHEAQVGVTLPWQAGVALHSRGPGCAGLGGGKGPAKWRLCR